MSRSPIDEFLTDEVNEYIRDQLLAAIEQMQTGKRYFTYNSFNVLLDADASTAIVEDELNIDRDSTLTIHEFRTLLLGAERL